MTRRWVNRPPGSNWGDFGDDDQLGRLNLLTPARVRRAAAEIVAGVSFCLSLPLDYPGASRLNPARHPPRLRPTVREGRPARNFRVGEVIEGAVDVSNDDVMTLHSQYSTQWDSLAHVGGMFDADGDGVAEAVFYNGFRAGRDIADFAAGDEVGAPPPAGVGALSVANMAATGVQGRGVMIDLYRHYGRDRHAVGHDDLMRILEDDGVTVEEGDMVCLHTGFAELLLEMERDPDAAVMAGSCAVLDGGDAKLLQWITDSGLAVLIADNYAVEGVPSREAPRPPGAWLPLHEHCLFKLGIHLGEIWYLSELAAWLAAHRRTRFFLTAPPLRMPGAVGSPVTPVATV